MVLPPDGLAPRARRRYKDGGKPVLLPIVQIILARGVGDGSLRTWVDKVKRWGFDTVVPAHLDAPLRAGPDVFAAAFDFAKDGESRVRFCDEDIALLREAESGPLSFSVGKAAVGPWRGVSCGLGGEPRVVGLPRTLGKLVSRDGWTPR